MTTIPGAYVPRRVRCTRVLEAEGWRLKVYETADDLDRPRRDLIEAAEGLVRRLPQPPDAAGRYGVGFLCVHDAHDACHAFVAWWDGTLLHQRAYVAPRDRPDALTPDERDGPIACVWNIPVIAFERGAWLDSMLAAPGDPDVERYLETSMDAKV